MDPNSGAGRKMARQMMQPQAGIDKEAAAQARAERPFPPKAKKLATIFVVSMSLIGFLPLGLELAGVQVPIGWWLSLLITLPLTLYSMIMMGLLSEGMTANLVSGVAVAIAIHIAFGAEFEPGNFEDAYLWRGAGFAVLAVVLVFFAKSLKGSLRELHYMVAEGQSMQDIMTRAQQANVIQKAGGTPAMNDKGEVIDANDYQPKPGMRQKKRRANATGSKTRKKPKLR